MLRARLLTAAVAIPLLLLLIFAAPVWLFAVVVGLIAVLGVAEYAVLAFPGRAVDRAFFILLGSAVAATASATPVPAILPAALAALVVAGLVWVLFTRADFERGLSDLGIGVLGALYVGLLLPHFVWLRGLDHGPAWVTFVLCIAMAGDSGGYFVGRALGRHKLMPRVSPGKTVEGAVGILVGSVVGALIGQLGLAWFVAWPLQIPEVVGLALVMGTLGQLGDLSESMLKRTFGAKESGWIFPGHGGVLDRIDSLLFPVTFVYYYTLLMH